MMSRWKQAIFLVAVTSAGHIKPDLDVPAGWEWCFRNGEYWYRRRSDGFDTTVHPAILAVWTSAYSDWPPSVLPTDRWNPPISFFVGVRELAPLVTRRLQLCVRGRHVPR